MIELKVDLKDMNCPLFGFNTTLLNLKNAMFDFSIGLNALKPLQIKLNMQLFNISTRLLVKILHPYTVNAEHPLFANSKT